MKNFIKTAAIALTGAMGLCGAANAAVSTSGCASTTECTLNELYAGGSITVLDVKFANFSFIDDLFGSFSGDDIVVRASSTADTVVLDFIIDALAGTIVSDLAEELEYALEFDTDLSAASPRSIIGASLSFIDTSRTGDANFAIGAVLPDGALVEILIDTFGDLLESDDSFGAQIAFLTALDLQGSSFGGFITSGGFRLTFQLDQAAAVPLPGAALFLLTGLAGVVVQRRRRRT